MWAGGLRGRVLGGSQRKTPQKALGAPSGVLQPLVSSHSLTTPTVSPLVKTNTLRPQSTMTTEKVNVAASTDTKELGEAGFDDAEHQSHVQTPPVAASTFEARPQKLAEL